jgi:predicted metalloprotease with PDZ domain
VDGAPHYIHIAADSDHALEMSTEMIAEYKNLVTQAGALFGARHYRDYHFLLTLSDHVASFGLEHHESSDDRLEERTLVDDGLRNKNADLLPHEFVHSWNGKYRRPAGLATKDYSEPMKGDLLWVYEGLTEYLGEVLAARSGLESEDRFRDWLAETAARLDHESGRAWRSLADTAISAQVLYDSREDYSGLRRGVDFYGEGALVWLEVDVLLRQLSHGSKSIDDFCRVFHGGPGGAPAVKPYTLDDLVATLKSVQPYDWAGFFQKRVESIEERGPLAGIENGGWKLVYNDKRSDYWTAIEDEHKVADLMFSLGIIVRNEGGVADVAIGGPVQKSGIAPGAKVTSVNGRQFTASVLREAVHSAAANNDPIELQVKNGEYFSMHRVDYHGGEKYPHLEREMGKPDLLSAILKPRALK